MRSFRFFVYLRKTIVFCLPFVCLFCGQPALALKLVASTALNMPEPNAFDFVNGVYRASSGDLYLSGIVNNWNTQEKEVIARYTPNLVLVSSANIVSSPAFAVDQDGNVYVAKNAISGGLAITKFTPGLAFKSSVTVNTAAGRYGEMFLGPDGDVYVSGLAGKISVDAKGYIVRLDQSLAIVSSIAINSGGLDRWCDVTVDTSGVVYAVTDTQFDDGLGLALFKYDSSFNLLASEELHLKANAGGTDLDLLDIAISSGEVFVGGEISDGINVSGFLAKFTSSPVFVSSATIIPAFGSIYGVAPADNGSVYLTGFKYLPNNLNVSEIVAAKVSSSLVLESSATYKDFDFYYNRGKSIVSDQAGNVFVAGSLASSRGGEINPDLWLAKLNGALSCVSSVTINGEEPESFTHLDSVALGTDGSVYVSGSGDYMNSGLVAKYSPHLVRISSATGFNNGESVYMDTDEVGNVYFRTEAAGVSIRTVYKYDKDLQFVSSRPFAGSFNYAGRLRVIAGSVFLSGRETDFSMYAGTWKFDSNLVLQSTEPFPGPHGFRDIASDEFGNFYSVGIGLPPGGGSSVGVLMKAAPDLVEISSVNFSSTTTPISVGVSTYSRSIFIGGIDAGGGFVSKFDYDLNLKSSMTFPGIQDGWPNTLVQKIVIAPDNNLIASGVFQNRLLLARISPDLVILSSMTIDFPENTFSEGDSVAVSRSGDVYVVGGSGPSSNSYPRTAWLGWFTYADEAGAQRGVTAAPFTALSTGSLTAVWASTYQATTLYYASISTSPDFSPVLASSSTYNTQAAFDGLGINTTYYARVYDPLKGAMVDLGSISTLAMPPAFLFLDSVWSSSAAISWTPNGNPDWTKYVIALWDGGVSSATIASVSTTSAVVGLPEGSTVYLSVRSMNNDGVVIPFYPIIGLLTLPAAQTAVQTGVDKTVLYNGPSGEIKANIPAGSFGEAVNVTIKTPAAWNVPGPTAGLLALNSPVNLEVTLDKNLQPSRDVEITVGYRDADLGGRDESKLVLARYDEAHAVWVPLLSTRDAANNRISAATRHFSLFQLMQVTPAATLSGVTVGPNPLRPSRNPGQKFTFRNLPADGRVRIYTYLGELLWEGNADVSGMAAWDGRNKWNSAVASGLYLALVEGRGGKKLLKLVIER